MNLYEYIDNYGIYSFEEKPFNEVDSVLFSFLSYVDYDNIVEKNKVRLKEVGRMHFGLHKKDEKNIIAVRDATKLLNYMKDTKRYGNCYLCHYVYEANSEYQFSAISIDFYKNYSYVSYEGTDQMISGWKEDFLLGINYPTLTHMKAIDYLNRFYSFRSRKIIVGGHSKGGNLALVASMNCNFLVRNKIKDVYNVDGPGLLKRQFESSKFARIHSIYHHIIPDDSLVGVLLHSEPYTVVDTDIDGVLAHDILYWKVQDDSFVRDKLSSFSKNLGEGLTDFVESYDKDSIRNLIHNFDKVCLRAKVESLLDIKNNPRKMIDLITECRFFDQESRNVLYDLFNIIIKAYGNSKYNDFMSFVKRFKIDI